MPIDLEKLGSFLKEKREDKGLSLYDISNSLCVRKSLIDAIERGNWTVLPHEVYVRGYLREYAHLLNVYEEISLDLIREEPKPVSLEAPNLKKPVVSERRFSKRVIALPLALILVGGLFLLSQLPKENTSFIPLPVKKAEHASTQASSVPVRDDQAAPSLETMEAKKLMITCQERTWISVVIDDTEKKEFMLNPQDIVVLNAKESYDLLIGNAAGVKLILNGNDTNFSGESGEVKRIKLS